MLFTKGHFPASVTFTLAGKVWFYKIMNDKISQILSVSARVYSIFANLVFLTILHTLSIIDTNSYHIYQTCAKTCLLQNIRAQNLIFQNFYNSADLKLS